MKRISIHEIQKLHFQKIWIHINKNNKHALIKTDDTALVKEAQFVHLCVWSKCPPEGSLVSVQPLLHCEGQPVSP